MSSDEDDYMSDKFVQNVEDVSVMPILSKSKRALEILKRKREVEEKLKQKKKSMRVVEQEKREEGLSSAISSDNKGFAMLAKMGYKPGQGIGKSQTGIAEPIGISVKEDKSGLGKDSQLKEYREKMKKREEEFNSTDYRSRLANKKAEQFLNYDLSKSQKICQQLDQESGVENAAEKYFWPKEESDKSDEEEEEEKKTDDEEEKDEDETPLGEKLETITRYLRSKYHYCIWCAVKYNNDDDLKENCPGNTRSDH